MPFEALVSFKILQAQITLFPKLCLHLSKRKGSNLIESKMTFGHTKYINPSESKPIQIFIFCGGGTALFL